MLEDMDTYVVSRSRYDKSATLESLGKLAELVTLIVPNKQITRYRKLADKHNCMLKGCPWDGIAKTRKFCGLITNVEKMLMLDDDLLFFRRVSSTDWHLKRPEALGCSLQEMFDLVSDTLDTYIHTSISAREGNNRLNYEGAQCSRPLRALAYRVEPFLELEHGRVDIMEDFDVTLQLLRKGYKNLVIAEWAQDQRQTQMEGGCSDYRTHELHAKNVRKLANLHKSFVRTREKKNKTGGKFGTRLEATIYWKKAWESSRSNDKPIKKAPTTRGLEIGRTT